MSKSLKKEPAAQSVVDLTAFHQQENAAKFPELEEVIRKLRPVLKTFCEHDFVGVPGSRKLVIQSQINHPLYHFETRNEASFIRLQGKWLQPLGFYPGGNVRLITLNGLIIICPEKLREEQLTDHEFVSGKKAM